MDRTQAARCLAKICAYVACGQLEKARAWRDELLAIFADAGV